MTRTTYCLQTFSIQAKKDNPNFDIINLFEEYLAAVSALAYESFLFLDKGSLLYDQCYDLCKEAGFIPDVAYTGHSIENLIDFVAQVWVLHYYLEDMQNIFIIKKLYVWILSRLLKAEFMPCALSVCLISSILLNEL